MPTHKAYRLHSYGGPETIHLDDVPVPQPGDRQVLVSVSAVGVNPFDWKIREGALRDHWHLDLPMILGVDFVGTVVALGEGAWRFKEGDRVMTLSNALGAYAEHIVVDEDILSRVPSTLSDVNAATLPIPSMTAWTALNVAGELRPGMKILIQGASGTAGAFAVQFAKAAGAQVVGTASAKNGKYVMELGADEFVDYQTQKFEDHVKDADLVLDFVLVGGSQNSSVRSWSVIKPGGALVTVADPAVLAQVPAGLRGFFPRVEPDVARLEYIADQVTRGNIKSKVAQVFSRSELGEALEISRAGGTTGRMIIDFKRA